MIEPRDLWRANQAAIAALTPPTRVGPDNWQTEQAALLRRMELGATARVKAQGGLEWFVTRLHASLWIASRPGRPMAYGDAYEVVEQMEA